MARVVDITVPSHQTEALVTGIAGLDGVIGIRVQPGASRLPPGDAISVTASNTALMALFQLLAAHQVGASSTSSVVLNEPTGLVSAAHWRDVSSEREDVTWEEMEYLAARDSHTRLPGVLMMAISGALATAGFATNQIHLIIAGQLMAPHYKSILQIPLGLAAGSRITTRRGLVDVARGYTALLVGAVLMALLLRAFGIDPTGGKSSYLSAHSLMPAFTGTSPTALTVDGLAAIAGALILVTYRRVFISGVIVAITLLPAAAAVGIALVVGDFHLAGNALLRLALDAALVIVLPFVVFVFQRVAVQRRPALQ